MLAGAQVRSAARSFAARARDWVFGTGDGDRPAALEAVLAAERRDITASRDVRYAANDAAVTAIDGYVGLALSGGGIRSATFSLGLLQGLHRLGLLRLVDYLSTVSGGGYAGSWWTAYLNRPETAPETFPPAERRELERAPDYVTDRARPDGARFAGTDPIHHLRLFANYLTPRKGLLTSDTWRAAAVISRNLILTWLVLFPVLCAAILGGQLYFVAQPFDDEVAATFVHAGVAKGADHGALHDEVDLWKRLAVAGRPLGWLLVLIALVTTLWMHYNNAGTRLTHAANLVAIVLILGGVFQTYWPDTLTAGSDGSWLRSHVWDVCLGVLALVTAAVIVYRIRRGAARDAVSRQSRATASTLWHVRLLVAFGMLSFLLGFAGFAHEFFLSSLDKLLGLKLDAWKDIIAGAGTLAAAVSAIFTAFKSAPTGGRDRREVGQPSLASRIVFAVTPPLLLVILAAGAAMVTHRWTYQLGSGPERIEPLAFAALTGLALALLFAWWENRQIPVAADRVPSVYLLAATVLLVAAVFFRLYPPEAGRTAAIHPRWLAIAACVAVLVGLLGVHRGTARVRGLLGFVTATVLVWLLVTHPGFDAVWAQGTAAARARPLTAGLALLAVLLGWVLALGWMADPNALSLHAFYKGRLVRAYLGASNPGRRERKHDIAEPDEGDDLRLAQLESFRRGGPYHIVNTTLNLVGSRDLASAQRSAANFILAPRFCGSVRTGFRPTDRYMNGSMTLGAAVATSGAAASPNMGSATPSPALALLLAAMNIRLGLWVPTPNQPNWTQPQTRFWPYYLLRESLSQTNDLASYCYLTDGGHFDNTGLYALVERGCRVIIFSDNGADPDRSFTDLGEAIRRVRIDFRAEIDLDTSRFRPGNTVTVTLDALPTALRLPPIRGGSDDAPEQAHGTTDGARSPAVHVVPGVIDYDPDHLRSLGWTDVTPAARRGRIFWIKPTLRPDDGADLTQYGLENPEFPQQSTLDQWFDEGQFESYRKLGEVSAIRAFGAAAAHAPLPSRLTRESVAQFFGRL